MLLLLSADFSKLTFSKNSFKNTIRVSNSLDLYQDQPVCKGYQQRKKVAASKERVKPITYGVNSVYLPFMYSVL